MLIQSTGQSRQTDPIVTHVRAYVGFEVVTQLSASVKVQHDRTSLLCLAVASFIDFHNFHYTGTSLVALVVPLFQRNSFNISSHFHIYRWTCNFVHSKRNKMKEHNISQSKNWNNTLNIQNKHCSTPAMAGAHTTENCTRASIKFQLFFNLEKSFTIIQQKDQVNASKITDILLNLTQNSNVFLYAYMCKINKTHNYKPSIFYKNQEIKVN